MCSCYFYKKITKPESKIHSICIDENQLKIFDKTIASYFSVIIQFCCCKIVCSHSSQNSTIFWQIKLKLTALAQNMQKSEVKSSPPYNAAVLICT